MLVGLLLLGMGCFAGYFKPSREAAAAGSEVDGTSWTGSISQPQLLAYPPDAGPYAATEAAGIVTVGAVPWVTNFNIPLYTNDMAAAKAVARGVATKGGGLPGVEVGSFLSAVTGINAPML